MRRIFTARFLKQWLAVICMITSYAVSAQVSVSGTVKEATGGAIPGVSVVIKGTLNGTTTDANGSFKVNVPSKESVLVFSSIGYTPKEVKVGSQSDLAVTLEADTKSLNEVVVTALGIKKDARRIGVAIQS